LAQTSGISCISDGFGAVDELVDGARLGWIRPGLGSSFALLPIENTGGLPGVVAI
jgi:hypothetical protein